MKQVIVKYQKKDYNKIKNKSIYHNQNNENG